MKWGIRRISITEEGATLKGESLCKRIQTLKFLAAHIYGTKQSPNKVSSNLQIETKITSYPIGWNHLGRTGDTRIIQWLWDEPTNAELKQCSTKDNQRQFEASHSLCLNSSSEKWVDNTALSHHDIFPACYLALRVTQTKNSVIP